MKYRMFVAAILLAVTGTGSAAAQNDARDADVLVAVSSVPLPNAAVAIVIRTANGTRPDMIIVDPRAHPDYVLRGAAVLLVRLRREQPVSTLTQVNEINSSISETPVPRSVHNRLAALFARAGAGDRRNVKNVGEVRLISIPLRQLL